LEDLIEELVGDIEAEYDLPPAYVNPAGSGWAAGGGVGLGDLSAATGVDLAADPPPGGAGTLTEWVAGHLGRPPRAGDVVSRAPGRVAVGKVRRGKVLEALVETDGGSGRR
jgi:CBS domain containing-hemolysin-like protein